MQLGEMPKKEAGIAPRPFSIQPNGVPPDHAGKAPSFLRVGPNVTFDVVRRLIPVVFHRTAKQASACGKFDAGFFHPHNVARTSVEITGEGCVARLIDVHM